MYVILVLVFLVPIDFYKVFWLDVFWLSFSDTATTELFDILFLDIENVFASPESIKEIFRLLLFFVLGSGDEAA